jgi:hypothetical protein
LDEGVWCSNQHSQFAGLFVHESSSKLLQVFSTSVNESICAVDGGCVTNSSVPELVLHTFSGKV